MGYLSIRMHHQEEGRGLGCEDIYLTSLPFTSRPIQSSPSASGFQRTSPTEKHSGLLYRSNCSRRAFRPTKLLMSCAVPLVHSAREGEKKTSCARLFCSVVYFSFNRECLGTEKKTRDKSVAALTAGSPSVINVEIAVCRAFVPRSSLCLRGHCYLEISLK